MTERVWKGTEAGVGRRERSCGEKERLALHCFRFIHIIWFLILCIDHHN